MAQRVLFLIRLKCQRHFFSPSGLAFQVSRDFPRMRQRDGLPTFFLYARVAARSGPCCFRL